MTLKAKLHPNRFTAMSPKMAAIVAYVLDADWTDPRIVEMTVTSDGHVLARHENDIGFNDFIGAEQELVRNWTNLLTVADLSQEEWAEAEQRFRHKIRRAA